MAELANTSRACKNLGGATLTPWVGYPTIDNQAVQRWPFQTIDRYAKLNSTPQVREHAKTIVEHMRGLPAASIFDAASFFMKKPCTDKKQHNHTNIYKI